MKHIAKYLFVGVLGSLILGCGPSHQAKPDLDPSPIPAPPSALEASEGFSWIVEGELAAMPLPGRNRPLEEDAAFLEQEGIRVLVSLTEEPPDAVVLRSRSIRQEHLPVIDFTPPTPDQMNEFAELVELSAAAGHPVGVHCTAGLGRSGTMAAAYLVTKGATADEAIQTVRELRPGSVETPEQEEAVRIFAEERQARR